MSSPTEDSYEAFKQRRRKSSLLFGNKEQVSEESLQSVRQESVSDNAAIKENGFESGEHGSVAKDEEVQGNDESHQGPAVLDEALLQSHSNRRASRHSYKQFKASRKSSISFKDLLAPVTTEDPAAQQHSEVASSNVTVCDSTGTDMVSGQSMQSSSEDFAPSEQAVRNIIPGSGDLAARQGSEVHSISCTGGTSSETWDSAGKDESSKQFFKDSEDKACRSSSTKMIEAPLAKAEALLEQFRILEAHELLVAAEQQLQEAGVSQEDFANFRSSVVYRAVATRIQQYLMVGDRTLAPTMNSEPLSLVCEQEGVKVFVYAPPGESWFVYRVVIEIDAPLAHCMVVGNELDLKTEWQPNLVETPQCFGDRKRLHLITQSMFSVLFLTIDIVIEVQRFCNKDFGFFAERLRSVFPVDGVEIPDPQIFTVRIGADTSNLWLPRGGDAEKSKRTVLVHSTRVEAGVSIPESILSFFLSSFAPDFAEKMRSMSEKPSEPGNPWAERLAVDNDGLYGELLEVERAASNRPEVSVASLPSQDIFKLPALSLASSEELPP